MRVKMIQYIGQDSVLLLPTEICHTLSGALDTSGCSLCVEFDLFADPHCSPYPQLEASRKHRCSKS